MLDIPEEVVKLLQTDCKRELVITFPNGEHEEINNNTIIQESMKFTESICSQSELEFGLCEASVLEFQALNLPNIKGCEIEASYRVYYPEPKINKTVETTVYTSNTDRVDIGKTYKKADNVTISFDVEGDAEFEMMLEGDKDHEEWGREEEYFPAGTKSFTYKKNVGKLAIIYFIVRGSKPIVVNETITTINGIEYYYEIKLGTFIVDECPKNYSNMSLRSIKAFSKDFETAYPQTFIDIISACGYSGHDVKPKLYFSDVQDLMFPDKLKKQIEMKSLVDSSRKHSFSQDYMDVFYKGYCPITSNTISGNNASIRNNDFYVKISGLTIDGVRIMIGSDVIDLRVDNAFAYNFYISDFLKLAKDTDGKTYAKWKSTTTGEIILVRFVMEEHLAQNSLIMLDVSTKKTITIEGRSEERDLRGTLGFIKCGNPNAFSNEIFNDPDFDFIFNTITEDMLIVDEFGNSGKVVTNIFDYLRPYANVDIGLGYYSIDSSYFTTPKEYKTIDLWSENESVYYIPKSTINSELGTEYRYFAQHIYLSKPSNKENNRYDISTGFLPPCIWTPTSLSVIKESSGGLVEVLYSFEAPSKAITNIEYGYKEQSTDGTEFFVANGGTKSVYALRKSASEQTAFQITNNITTLKLPDSKENLEASLELQGKFGKIGRDGALKEYSFGSDILYPSHDVIPSSDIYPGSSDENVDSFLYTRKDYINFWYEDELSKLYGAVSCQYTNVDGNRYTMTVFIDDRDDSSAYKTYDISNNNIIKTNQYTAEEIHDILYDLGQAIKNIQYMPFRMSANGFPQVEAGDMAIVLTQSGTVSSYILRRTISGIQSIKDNIESN